ncbi:MAG: GntR family transcriptional regulator [Phycisphaerae bacterium]|nr:GntR family transcriptional regulator [Phycisphaerae bacterium]MDW8262067.1 GntR family transcriptional regulator [Phycisphaerales bacterium]
MPDLLPPAGGPAIEAERLPQACAREAGDGIRRGSSGKGQQTMAARNASAEENDATRNLRLSYKFQRLRERLRDAIRKGELSGKLPGERQLARKMRVNAKTLSKALTDLAAEGVLQRCIGRGTYVRGSEAIADGRDKWLFVVEHANRFLWMRKALESINPRLQVVRSRDPLRPSELAGVKCVIDMAIDTPPETVRMFLHRGMTVVSVNKQPAAYSTHSVQVDRPAGAANLARELMLCGHQRVLVIEGERGRAPVGEIVRQIVRRYTPEGVVEVGSATDIGPATRNGFTAVIAGCRYSAERAMNEATRLGLSVPQQLSVTGVGAGDERFPCSGYWVHIREFASALADMLRDGLPQKPITLWLAGVYHELGTVAAPASMVGSESALRGTFLNHPGLGAG